MFKNSNLHAYDKTRHTFTLTNVPHKQHMHNCHDLYTIKLKTTNPTNNLKMTSHQKENDKRKEHDKIDLALSNHVWRW